VARIPRVPGGGTHRAGQGAFGNMCRGGGMFSPKKTWRRWHRKINLKERRHALASAIAATAVPGLVMARGHRVDNVREMPIVVSDELQDFVKTKSAKKLLEQLGCDEDLDKSRDSLRIRKGRGKMRNRRYTCRRGPLVVYSKSNGCHHAFRALPGVNMLNVDSLNLLKLAPGGSLGRLVVWTESAFKRLDEIFGEVRPGTSQLKSYTLPRSVMTNADLSRIINSTEVQTMLKPAKEMPKKSKSQVPNPLTNKQAMAKLNPAAPVMRKRQRLATNKDKCEFQFMDEKRKKLSSNVEAARKKRRAVVLGEEADLEKKVAESAALKNAERAPADIDSSDEE